MTLMTSYFPYTDSSSRSSKIIDLGANQFSTVISINFGRFSYSFRDIDA